MKNPRSTIVSLGVFGFVIGGLVGFLARPTLPLFGQVSFEDVMTRGAMLKGVEQFLVPTAQQSFNVTLIGAILGATGGAMFGYFVSRK